MHRSTGFSTVVEKRSSERRLSLVVRGEVAWSPSLDTEVLRTAAIVIRRASHPSTRGGQSGKQLSTGRRPPCSASWIYCAPHSDSPCRILRTHPDRARGSSVGWLETMVRPHAETNLSTQYETPQTQARFPGSYEDSRGPRDPQEPAFQGSRAPVGVVLVEVPGVPAVKRSSDFRRIVASGERHKGVNLTTFTSQADGGTGRLGLAVRVAPHSAVVRNRARRRLRAAFVAAGGLDAGRDVVVRAERGVAFVEFQELVRDMRTALDGVGR